VNILETHVAIIILCEAIAIVLCVWGLLHEEKVIRFERAFFGAVLWTLWERFAVPVIIRIQKKEG